MADERGRQGAGPLSYLGGDKLYGEGGGSKYPAINVSVFRWKRTLDISDENTPQIDLPLTGREISHRDRECQTFARWEDATGKTGKNVPWGVVRRDVRALWSNLVNRELDSREKKFREKKTSEKATPPEWSRNRLTQRKGILWPKFTGERGACRRKIKYWSFETREGGHDGGSSAT